MLISHTGVARAQIQQHQWLHLPQQEEHHANLHIGVAGAQIQQHQWLHLPEQGGAPC